MTSLNSTTARNILRVDSSMRRDGSVTRELGNELIQELTAANPGSEVTHRDLADGVAFITEAWIGANFTAVEERSTEQRAILAQSDALVAEVQRADTLVISVPIYNFGVPAALKAWIDMICRARLTFAYSEDGPKGLLTGKRAYLLVASGGTTAGSDVDFATDYMRHVLGFIGIRDVEIVDASGLMKDADAALARARTQIGGRQPEMAIAV